jgi:predicted kinase
MVLPDRERTSGSRNMPTLILLCGLPGAGKTTRARQLAAERGAVRLCPDEWLASLGTDPRDEPVRDRLERTLTDHALGLLALGLDVILEYGFWGRTERDLKREQARSVGARVELHALILPIEELWHRLEGRNADPPWGSVPISRAELEDWWQIFTPQVPDNAELALFDGGEIRTIW